MIKSTLDLRRQLPSPNLEPGEEIIERCSGSLDVGTSAFPVFRACNLYLTDRRLIIAQVRKVIRDFPYSKIDSLEITRRPWIAGKKKLQLKISLKSGRVFFVVMNEPERWLTSIASFAEMEVTKESE